MDGGHAVVFTTLPVAFVDTSQFYPSRTMTSVMAQQSVLSPLAASFVPSSPAPPAVFFRSEPAKPSATETQIKQGKRGSARAQQSQNMIPASDSRVSSIKKPKSPPMRAPTHSSTDGPMVRLSGVKLVRSKSDRDRLLQVAQEIVESMPPPLPKAPLEAPADFLNFSGVPLTRSAASELAIIMDNDCCLGF